VTEARPFRGDVANRNGRRSERGCKRRREKKSLGCAKVTGCGFEHAVCEDSLPILPYLLLVTWLTRDNQRAMARTFDIITFDCYGTLIDWENGIADAFHRAAECDGVHIARDEVLRAYATIEPIVEQ